MRVQEGGVRSMSDEPTLEELTYYSNLYYEEEMRKEYEEELRKEQESKKEEGE